MPFSGCSSSAPLEPAMKEGKWPSDKVCDYIAEKCADSFFVPIIESMKAVSNLDAICSIPGASVLFIGPDNSRLLKDIMTTAFTALRKG